MEYAYFFICFRYQIVVGGVYLDEPKRGTTSLDVECLLENDRQNHVLGETLIHKWGAEHWGTEFPLFFAKLW